MLKRFIVFALLVTALSALAACSPASTAPTATPIPANTPTNTVPADTATTVPADTATTVPADTATATVPANTATPTVSATAATGEAPSFTQIGAEVQVILTGTNAYDDLQAYSAGHKGQKFTDRVGWAATTPYSNGDGTYGLEVYIEDPYSPAALAAPRINMDLGEMTAILSPFPAELVKQVHPGDQLVFSGEFVSVDQSIGVQLTIQPSAVKSAAQPSANPTTTAPTIGATVPAATPAAVPTSTDTVTLDEIKANIAKLSDADLITYLTSLNGKHITGLAWIGVNRDGKWQISLDDPFGVVPVGATQPSFSDSGQKVYITLAVDKSQTLRVGQKVSLSGVLGQGDSGYSAGLEISADTVTVVEDRLSGLKAPADLADLVMSLERTACYGSCPIYSVTVYGNGTVIWYGERFVAVSGLHISTVGEDTVRALLAAYQKAGYFNLDDEYSDYRVTDLPYVHTALTFSGQSKTINHYLGDLGAPARLKVLEALFDDLIGTSAWIGTR